MTMSKIAFAVNEETIWRSTCVYASDKPLAYFVIPRVQGRQKGRGSLAHTDRRGSSIRRLTLGRTLRCLDTQRVKFGHEIGKPGSGRSPAEHFIRAHADAEHRAAKHFKCRAQFGGLGFGRNVHLEIDRIVFMFAHKMPIQ